MSQLPTFEARFNYLQLFGKVGDETFGSERYFNQLFYHGGLWQEVRNEIIVRDLGRDLSMPDKTYEITGSIYIHHMNPASLEEMMDCREELLNPEFLVCCSFDTHNAIHYSRKTPSLPAIADRKYGDTCPWKGVHNVGYCK